MKYRFLINIGLLVIISTNLYAQAKKNPLLDSIAINESISTMLRTEDILLGNRDIRNYRPNPEEYLRYKSIFRVTFFSGEENRPMAIEIAQKYSGEFNIIFKMTVGNFEIVNDMVYPSSDGVKIIFFDKLSEIATKKANILFNNLSLFSPVKISRMGTCSYRIEYQDVLRSYYFENTIFCSNGDKNYHEIIGTLKEITKDIAISKKLKDTLFESWAKH
ncbi:MAG: hypothetical protein GXY77_19095 [Fibrobacter sp.]|nr:hypothetical protein [Fibrobacter sp.]